MVAVEHDPGGASLRIVLQPDAALTRRQTFLAYGLIALSCGAIAVFFAIRGFWLVLPFAGLEIGLLAWALRAVMDRMHLREVIAIRDGKTEIAKQRHRSTRHWCFETYWTEVALERPVHRWYAHRLLVRSRGEEVELGDFLQEEERSALASRLQRWIGPMAAPGERV